MLNSQRHLFDLQPDITYLNCAYMSPLMKSVEEAGIKGVLAKKHPWNVGLKEFFDPTESLRKEAAVLLNVSDPMRIVTIPSVSYGMAQVARNLHLGSGDEIVVLQDQFPSSVYAWDRLLSDSGATLVTARPPEDHTHRGAGWNQAALDAVNDRTRLVVMEHIHWADGTYFDLEAMRARCDEHGSLLVVDATQSLGAIPFDQQVIRADAVIAAGYKTLMGPYSIGFAYYGPAFDDGSPVEENWINRRDSHDFGDLVHYKKEYQPGALRFEVGEHSNFILVPMMLEALRMINKWNPERVKAYCDELVREAVTKLRTAGYLIGEDKWRASNLFGIRAPEGTDLTALQTKLREHQIYVSVRGNSVRVSPHVYNTTEDMDRLIEVLISD